eukprot:14336463-Alexandrium_andersonii.AAC.1
MSASLVGSEMCIRDSPPPSFRWTGLARPSRAGPACTECGIAGDGSGKTAGQSSVGAVAPPRSRTRTTWLRSINHPK